ncbi:hypothetical protein FRX31_002560 [Thalictrum thalictroides]|uniref:Uncharacterized protein n=1 Tax=Thalictrum thalictroides TaxID=46969 RepID=A0A7J6XGS8_THATH|nr:hypothetical protein FRX31_002560 [Thalictrum thalictroides]
MMEMCERELSLGLEAAMEYRSLDCTFLGLEFKIVGDYFCVMNILWDQVTSESAGELLWTDRVAAKAWIVDAENIRSGPTISSKVA